jgi:hypothetical protein
VVWEKAYVSPIFSVLGRAFDHHVLVQIHWNPPPASDILLWITWFQTLFANLCLQKTPKGFQLVVHKKGVNAVLRL